MITQRFNLSYILEPFGLYITITHSDQNRLQTLPVIMAVQVLNRAFTWEGGSEQMREDKAVILQGVQFKASDSE